MKTSFTATSVMLILAIGWIGTLTYQFVRTTPEQAIYGKKYFTVFQQLSDKSRAYRSAGQQPIATSNGQRLDTSPVGTIQPPATIGKQTRAKQPVVRLRGPILVEMHVLGIFGDQAMIEGPNGINMLKVGDYISPHGKILQIYESNHHWTVITEKGIITN